MHSSYSTQIHEGMDVLDSDGEKIGKCGESLGEYFNVDAGFLGTTEYYVPFSAITDVSDNNIFVNARKSQIRELGWDRRPEMTEMSDTRGASSMTDRGNFADSQQTVQLREEELHARTRAVETGSVHVGKEIVEEQQTLDVPVTHEEVYVERRPVERRPADQAIGDMESQTIRVPVTEEHVEVEKTPVVYEEVGVGKRAVQETQQVSDTVRREELRVENEGDVEFRRD
jgi:uncharacterized protein (TIGR02271 family)